MRKLLLSLSLILLVSSCAAELAGQTGKVKGLTPTSTTQMPFALAYETFAVWSGGAFVFVQHRLSGAPDFQIFDRNGTQLSQFTFRIPGAAVINIYDHSVALGADNSLAIVGTAYTDDSKGGMFLAWVSPDRQQQTIVRTSPFFPKAVTLAADGTIWVAGYEPKPHRDYDYSQNLIRRYDKTGKLLGSFIPWSSLGTTPRPIPTVDSVLLPAKDRVGWYSPDSHTYLEFSLNGSVLSRFKSAPHPEHDTTDVALCEDGSLYASTAILREDHQQTNWGIFTLDRQRGEWSLIQRKERWGILFGCDGARLATATDFNTISWLQSP